MSTTSTTAITSLDGFHANRSAQNADELVRAYIDAVNVEDTARIDELLARSFLSYDVHSTRSAHRPEALPHGPSRFLLGPSF